MSRFSENRHWTLILALGVCLASSAITLDTVAADPIYESVGDDPGLGGGDTGIGDPDVPDGAGKHKAFKSGALGRGSMSNGARVAGDDATSRGWVGRLRLTWIVLRSSWFRF